jgi:hypothetical protein
MHGTGNSERFGIALCAVLGVVAVWVTSEGAGDVYGVARGTAVILTVVAFGVAMLLLGLVVRWLQRQLVHRLRASAPQQPIVAQVQERVSSNDPT